MSVTLVLPAVVLVLCAGSPGAFVDLAADRAWRTARPLRDFVLDQHVPAPAEWVSATSLSDASVIDQAIRALVGQGYPPEQAERHLLAEGADAGTTRHAVCLRILAGLNAR